jgi:hypothetical protein
MALVGRAMDASRYAFAVRERVQSSALGGQKVVVSNVSQNP